MVDGHNTDLIIHYTIRSIKVLTIERMWKVWVCCLLPCVASGNCILKNGTQSNQIEAPVHYVWTSQKVFKHAHSDVVCMHNVSRYPIHVYHSGDISCMLTILHHAEDDYNDDNIIFVQHLL